MTGGWRAMAAAGVLACALIGGVATRAAAHPEDGRIFIALMGVVPSDQGRDSLSAMLRVGNNTGGAVTLREITAPGYDVDFERRREVFGAASWQKIDFLRLEPGVVRLLEAPDYSVTLWPQGPNTPGPDDLVIYADFGPAGVVSTEDWRQNLDPALGGVGPGMGAPTGPLGAPPEI